MTRPLVNNDPPSCDFLKTNIAAEKTAIGAYTGEAARTNDPIWKAAIHAQAVEEMGHLETLEGAWDGLGCDDEHASLVQAPEQDEEPEEFQGFTESDLPDEFQVFLESEHGKHRANARNYVL